MPKVSILVPLRPERGLAGAARVDNWQWLERRWGVLFPEAELVVGTDDGADPFSKSQAVNDAYARSSGDTLVVADADSWVEMPQLVAGIHYARKLGVLVVPWTTASRLTKQDSDQVRSLDPSTPNPVTAAMVRGVEDYRPSPSTAAMVVVLTRESFERVGGMDPRFRGWGQEDVCFGLACAALLGRTHIMPGHGFALWHDRPRVRGRRVWEADSGSHNVPLGRRYRRATLRPDLMATICAEHPLPGAATPVGPSPRVGSRPAGQVVREFARAGTADGERIAL